MIDNILSKLDSYTPHCDILDQQYVPPLLQSFVPNLVLLGALRAMTVPNTPGLSLMQKIDRSPDGHTVLAVRDVFIEQSDWPGFMSFIWRDGPDDRGKTITFLPNEDTLAVILAVRLGLQAEVAVALAHQNLIYGAKLDCECASTPDYHDSALLGTLTTPGAPRAVHLALFAREKASTFTTALRKEELILLHQTEDIGLFRGLGSYNVEVLQPLRCRTDEVVWADLSIGGLSQ